MRCGWVIRLVAPHLDENAEEKAVCLLVSAGPADVGTQFYLAGEGPISVGKSRERDLQLADPKVSRLHCRLVRSEQGWRVEDADSTNGVWIGGARVKSHELRHGDKVQIGDTELICVTPTRTAEPSSDAGLSSRVRVVEVKRKPAPVAGEVFDSDGLLRLADGEVDRTVAPPVPAEISRVKAAQTAVPTGPTCPSCGKVLFKGAVICTDCGVNIKTGRALLTSLDTGIDEIYMAADSVTRWLSWILPVGLFPLASEAFGTRKPYVVRTIAVITAAVSICFLVLMYSGSAKFSTWGRLALWGGHIHAGQMDIDDAPAEVRDVVAESESGVFRYRPVQLLTHTLLHGGIMHLVGNLVFLLVFGSRVNALIGQSLTFLVYLILAVLAGMSQMAAGANEPSHAIIGASGAIMGLAGMYFVFFPVSKVHMVFWYRFGLVFGFRLSSHIFALRGFWVVLFYIGLDVLSTVRGSQDGVGHWAHLGGFIFGMAIATAMMVTRLVNARGGDVFSLIFGRWAWGLVGSPGGRSLLDGLPRFALPRRGADNQSAD